MEKEAARNQIILKLNIVDSNGILYLSNKKIVDVNSEDWYKKSRGKSYISEPFMLTGLNQFVVVVCVPVMDDSNTQIATLFAILSGTHLCDFIKDITVGKTGYAFILGLTGTNIAHKSTALVEEQRNVIEKSNTDASLRSIAEFEKIAMKNSAASVGFYDYKGDTKIASYAHMKTTGWTLIITAPQQEFMGTVNALRLSMLMIGGIIFVVSILLTYFFARNMVKPIENAVAALRNIAQGEGDLTVRLPVTGNDEMTDMAEYFNETIVKIGASIRQVGIKL